jgi:[ribosomal protein S5]-alanine N-acetyltransferase
MTELGRGDPAAGAGPPSILRLPLRTARLLLRDFVAADWEAVHAYASDPEVVHFMYWGPRDAAESQGYIRRMLATQRERPRTTWELAVVRMADHRLLGACDLTPLTPGEADLGYVLARDAWGQGYATEAAQALVAAGFAQLNLRRIVATCDPRNLASARVLEKAGLRRAETLHRHQWAKGRWWDALRYEVHREDCGATSA